MLMVLLGVGAACFAGVAFAILTVGMRKTATENTSPEAIVFFINVMGILFLGPWAAAQLGLRGMLATSPADLIVMLAIGVCNLLAFLLMAKALQLTGVVRVNVINNALTTALTVLAGIVDLRRTGESGIDDWHCAHAGRHRADQLPPRRRKPGGRRRLGRPVPAEGMQE